MTPYPADADADTVLVDFDDDLIDRGPRTQPMLYRAPEAAMSPNVHQLRAAAVRAAQGFANLLHPDPAEPAPMCCSACAGAGIACPSPQACRHELVDGPAPRGAVQTPAPPRRPLGHGLLSEPADVPAGIFRLLVVAVVTVLAIVAGVSLLAGNARAGTVASSHGRAL